MPCLGPESGQGFCLPSVSRMQELDGDRPRQGGISSAPYLAEPAGTDGLIKPITTGEKSSHGNHQRSLPIINGP